MQINLSRRRAYMFKEGLKRYADELEIYVLQGRKDFAAELKEVEELMRLMDARMAPLPEMEDIIL